MHAIKRGLFQLKITSKCGGGNQEGFRVPREEGLNKADVRCVFVQKLVSNLSLWLKDVETFSGLIIVLFKI